jgi:hypothetical protein
MLMLGFRNSLVAVSRGQRAAKARKKKPKERMKRKKGKTSSSVFGHIKWILITFLSKKHNRRNSRRAKQKNPFEVFFFGVDEKVKSSRDGLKCYVNGGTRSASGRNSQLFVIQLNRKVSLVPRFPAISISIMLEQ